MILIRATILAVACACLVQPASAMTRAKLDALVVAHAAANGVPAELVHRVIVRESKYNPHLIGKGSAMGLMQIKPATARGLGYGGSAEGLLDAETNLTYAVRYLAGAYRLAEGNHDRAVTYYARGYYYAAKGKGKTVPALATPAVESAALVPVIEPAAPVEEETLAVETMTPLEEKRDREP